MKNNKLVAVVLALLVCLSLVVSVSAATTNNLTFAVEPQGSTVEGIGVIAHPDDTFSVSVNIKENTGFMAAQFSVEFDSNSLELVEIKDVNSIFTATKGEGVVKFNAGDWKAALAGSEKPITFTGSVATLTFKVISKVDAASNIAVVARKTDVIDAEGYPSFAFTCENAKISTVGSNHVCDAGNTIDANNGKEATCSVPGKETDKLCAVCGKVLVVGKEIPTIPHTWDNGVVSKAPTCEATGETTLSCTVCGEKKVSEELIPAIGHNWGAPFISKPATCSEVGHFSVICANCKESVEIETTIPATGHTWNKGVVTTQPGCTTMGVQTFTCVNCGEQQVDETVPAIGHAYGAFVETKPATVEEEGLKTSTCANCGDVKTESIPKLPEPAKSNVALIVCIVAAVVLVGAGCAAFFVLKNKKK